MQTLLKTIRRFHNVLYRNRCIKEDLSVFDGKKDLKFINQEGLKSLKKYLKKKVSFSDLVIIFEPTGVYSLY